LGQFNTNYIIFREMLKLPFPHPPKRKIQEKKKKKKKIFKEK